MDTESHRGSVMVYYRMKTGVGKTVHIVPVKRQVSSVADLRCFGEVGQYFTEFREGHGAAIDVATFMKSASVVTERESLYKPFPM